MLKTALSDIWVRRNFGFGIMIIVCVFGAVITSLIPLKFTSTAQVQLTPIANKILSPDDILSDTDKINSLINSESAYIKDEIIPKVIKQRKLLKNPEINPDANPKYSFVSKMLDHIRDVLDGGEWKSLTAQERIHRTIIQNLTINITKDYMMVITYNGPYPHVTRDITTLLAKNYVWAKTPHLQKKIKKIPDLPDFFSTPDLFYAIYCTAAIALLLGIFGTVFIKPQNI